MKKIQSSKLLSLVVSVVLLCTAFSVPFSASAEASETPEATAPVIFWGGTAAVASEDGTLPFPGSGTVADPYQISTGEQLAYITVNCTWETTRTKHYKLMNDIYLNDTSANDWYDAEEYGTKPWLFNDTEAAFFGGIFDGNGHTVYGLYINGEYGKAGLFGCVGGQAVIKNLRISKAYINNTRDWDYAGTAVFAGIRHAWFDTKAIEFSNCVVEDDVQIIAKNGNMGAFVGYNGCKTGGITVDNCYSAAQITRTTDWSKVAKVCNFVGGRREFAGAGITIKNSYAVGNRELAVFDETVEPNVVPTVINSYTTYADSTQATFINPAYAIGVAAKRSMNALDFENVWTTQAGDGPMLRLFCDSAVNSDALWDVWDGTQATEFAGGTGTETDPYLIATPEQLAYLCNTDSRTYKHYKLTDDIYLNDVSVENWHDESNNPKEWTGGTSNAVDHRFGGNLDGDGHVIYGLYIKGDYGTAALFGGLDGKPNIHDLGIKMSYIHNTRNNNFANAGAFCGERTWTTGDGAVFSNCFVDDTVQIIAVNPSGFVGYVSDNKPVTFDNCYSGAKLQTVYTHGLPAYRFAGCKMCKNTVVTVKNSYSVGDQDFAPTTNNGTLTVENCYTTYADSTAEGITVLDKSAMLGQGMSTLDFTDTWSAFDASIPQLRVFAVSGDVNSDKAVTILDLVRVKKNIADSSVSLNNYSAADMNSDRKINASDLTLLRKVLLGVSANFQ